MPVASPRGGVGPFRGGTAGASIGGRLLISSNAAPDTVTLGAIESIPDDFTFNGNPLVTTLPLTAGLTDVQGNLAISGNAGLTSLDLSALTQSFSAPLCGAPILDECGSGP